jgi:hypothetical protein
LLFVVWIMILFIRTGQQIVKIDHFLFIYPFWAITNRWIGGAVRPPQKKTNRQIDKQPWQPVICSINHHGVQQTSSFCGWIHHDEWGRIKSLVQYSHCWQIYCCNWGRIWEPPWCRVLYQWRWCCPWQAGQHTSKGRKGTHCEHRPIQIRYNV